MVKRIDKLTPEQEARFGEWSKKWIDIGLSTEPADFDMATEGENFNMDKERHIYFGTTTNPNPYEQDATPEQIAERQQKIDALVDHLLSGKCKPSDLLQEDCYDLVDMLIVALFRKNTHMEDKCYEATNILIDAAGRSATWLIDSSNNTATLAIKKKLGVE